MEKDTYPQLEPVLQHRRGSMADSTLGTLLVMPVDEDRIGLKAHPPFTVEPLGNPHHPSQGTHEEGGDVEEGDER